MGWFEYEEQLNRPCFFYIDKRQIGEEYDNNMSGKGEEQKMVAYCVFSSNS